MTSISQIRCSLGLFILIFALVSPLTKAQIPITQTWPPTDWPAVPNFATDGYLNAVLAPLGQFTGKVVTSASDSAVVRTASYATASNLITLSGTGALPTPGMFVFGTGITANTTVSAVNANTGVVTLSANTTAASATTANNVKFAFEFSRTVAAASVGSTTLTLTGAGPYPQEGWYVNGTGMPAGVTVTGGNGTTTVTLSAPATAAIAVSSVMIFSKGPVRTATYASGGVTLTLSGTATFIPSVGQAVSGIGIPPGTTVMQVSGTTVTLSDNATSANFTAPRNYVTFVPLIVSDLPAGQLLPLKVASLSINGSAIDVSGGSLSVGGVSYAPQSALTGYAALNTANGDTIQVPSGTPGTDLTLSATTTGLSRIPSNLTVERNLTVSNTGTASFYGNVVLNGTVVTNPSLGNSALGTSTIYVSNTAVPGGNSLTLGGNNNQATNGSVIIGGFNPSTASQFNIASGMASMILGAKGAQVESESSVVIGGQGNQILGAASARSFVLGGQGNIVSGGGGVIIGAGNNSMSDASFGTSIGGVWNTVSGPGYALSIVGSLESGIGGVRGSLVDHGGGNYHQGYLAATGETSSSAIVGGWRNSIENYNPSANAPWYPKVTSVILGGIYNTVKTGSGLTAIIGGSSNEVANEGSTVIGSVSSKVTGQYSTAVASQGALASGSFQLVLGKFNAADTSKAFIIGNGTGDSTRSNAFSVDSNGNVLANGAAFSGRVRITPKGGISMGEFTQEPAP